MASPAVIKSFFGAFVIEVGTTVFPRLYATMAEAKEACAEINKHRIDAKKVFVK